MSDDSKGKDVVDLINLIDSTLKRVQTNSLDLSFNELMDMHKSGELDISPDYQRLFQWSEGARSRFVESLLLEMPVPPIYVIEEEDGHYLLIDGLQRISSYLHLRGHLNAEHLDPPVNIGEKLVLAECDIIQELNGKTYDDLGTALQIRLKSGFGKAVWALPRFWCKRRSGFRIGASLLLITVTRFRRVVWIFIISRSSRLAEISPPFEAFNPSVL